MSSRKGQAMVTGVAGFIGSHLAERLVAEGYQVLGVDCFTDYYPRAMKEANLINLRQSPQFRFVEGDILELNWASLLDSVDYLFHEAAQAGVRGSWGDSFGIYVRNNVLATQRLLEAAKGTHTLRAFIYASSSSIYGDARTYPTPENTTPMPVSPYGVTKLACEHLCRMYHQSFGVPMVMLRYFTAYGPRQRPDMAFYKFITAMLRNDMIVVYGDGEQTRDFTYVSDVVEANILAMNHPLEGQAVNIGGGSRITVNTVIDMLESITGRQARRSYTGWQKGDTRHTSADVTQAERVLGYQPQVGIEQGLRQQVQWLAQLMEQRG